MSQFAEASFKFLFIVVVICAILSYILLTLLVKAEHDDFYAQWKKDGSPNGLPFWVAPNKPLKYVPGFNPRDRLGIKWLFKTPDWVNKHKTALSFFHLFRISSYTAWGGLFIIFVIFLVSFSR